MSKSVQAARETITHGVIALSVCLGGYMLLVDGPRRGAAAARGEAETIAAQLREAESIRDQVPMLTAARQKTRATVQAFADAGRLAREERDLYAGIMAIADSCQVTVEQMAPAKLGSKSSAHQPMAKEADSSRDLTVAYTITATGSYKAVATFLKSLRTDLGHSMVRAVRLAPLPADPEPIVRAVIETEHYSFDASPAPAGESARVAGAGGP